MTKPSPQRLVSANVGADDDDAALVAAASQGDAGACFRIWSKYSSMVLRLVRAYFGPAAESDDLAQEVFLRVFSRIDELREPGALRGFIAGICLGVARNMSRRARIRAALHVGSNETTEPEVPMSGVEDEARQTLRHLWRLLDAATDEDRSLFVARYVEKLEMSDVATAHGISIGTAKRRMNRMKERMEAAMQQDAVLAEYASKLQRKGGQDR